MTTDEKQVMVNNAVLCCMNDRDIYNKALVIFRENPLESVLRRSCTLMDMLIASAKDCHIKRDLRGVRMSAVRVFWQELENTMMEELVRLGYRGVQVFSAPTKTQSTTTEKETPMNKTYIQHKTLICGNDIDEMSDSDLIAAIKGIKGDYAVLTAVVDEKQSKKVAKTCSQMNDAIELLLAKLDSDQ